MLNRAVWVEINLDHLAHNISEVRRVTKNDAKVTAVIKADGYGHGAVHIARTLLDNGADRLAVATLTEALQLRKTFKETEILILGFTEESSVHLAVENNLIQTIYTNDQARKFNEIAKSLNKTLKVHIKLDTGMTRLGMMPESKTIEAIEEMKKCENLYVEGMYTHFARADEFDKTTTQKQVENFEFIRKGLEEKGIVLDIYHVSNSASIIDLPEYNYDMVRAGIMLYGLYPSDEVNRDDVKLKEVMSLHTKISRVQEVEPNVGVSYGHKYVTDEVRKIGTLPIGYADGFSRSLTFKAEAIIKGKDKKVPVIGRICMDQCMIDVTGIDVAIGDEVILFGKDGQMAITIDDIAGHLDTINYEVVCMINRRVPRVYKSSGKVVKVVDYIMSL
ncbi:alanine racemase [Acidaminobacter sp. JC074]|uniref:alanine racemase n=1 Tax=Acidaminobacter sp. JC074 TaxID=2530199 RepID=UPI001F0E4EC0|nr:alanine racemase [Acidaminobacter sp. JC074]